MKTLIIRLLGLGDVANILIPAARMIKAKDPSSTVDVLTYGAGVELADLCPEISDVLAVGKEQWPDEGPSPVYSKRIAISRTVVPDEGPCRGAGLGATPHSGF